MHEFPVENNVLYLYRYTVHSNNNLAVGLGDEIIKLFRYLFLMPIQSKVFFAFSLSF